MAPDHVITMLAIPWRLHSSVHKQSYVSDSVNFASFLDGLDVHVERIIFHKDNSTKNKLPNQQTKVLHSFVPQDSATPLLGTGTLPLVGAEKVNADCQLQAEYLRHLYPF